MLELWPNISEKLHIVMWIGELGIKMVEFTNCLQFEVTWKYHSLFAKLLGLSSIIGPDVLWFPKLDSRRGICIF
jgi:hypothetical protein